MEDRSRILEEAVKDLHKNETFERALGRTLRRHGRSYREYLDLIAEVRDRARQDGVDIVEAARRVASES
jgi:hypothetical protein